MTRKELCDFIGFTNICTLSPYIDKAKKLHPEKFGHENIYDSSTVYSFNKDEVECIVNCIGTLNELERILVVEQVVEGPRYVKLTDPYIPGTREFVEEYNQNKYNKEVCSCCNYLMKKSWNGGKTPRLYPFCRFYNRFISHMQVQERGKLRKASIFKDKCDSWKRGEIVLFTKE